MKSIHRKTLFATWAFISLASSAEAADRVRAGQWVGKTAVKEKTYPSSQCLTQSDAEALNGDAKSIRIYLEKTIPPEICKLSNIKANGSEVIYTAACGNAAANVVTTKYHGDSFESISTDGTKSEAKLVGACK